MFVRVRVQLQLILSCFVFCSVSSCVREYRTTCVLKFCDRLERTANETDQLMHIPTGQICSDLNTNYWAVLWIKKPMFIKNSEHSGCSSAGTTISWWRD